MAWKAARSSLLLVFLTTACSGPQIDSTPTPSQTLRPYPSNTPTAIIQETPHIPTAPALGPTPTPLVHLVQQGDTLLGIAIRYGVELDDLLLANPGIDPDLLRVGFELTIPGEGGQPVEVLLPTPTPIPLTLSPVSCYAIPPQGQWCLTVVENSTESDVEAVVVLFTLISEDGQVVDRGAAYGALNRVPASTRLPLAAFFESVPDGQPIVIAALLSAVPINVDDQRYYDVAIQIEEMESIEGDLGKRVTGEYRVEDAEAGTFYDVRMVVVAIDGEGHAVGFQIWESDGPVTSDGWLSFELTVFSLGPAIEHLEFLAEARPSS